MKKTEKHTHHHWELPPLALNWLLKWLLAFVLIAALVGIVSDSSDNKEYMHKNCLDTCVAKPFYWNQELPENVFIESNTECIHDCNQFYIALAVD